MPVRRPKRGEPEGAGIELTEHLVKKSLDVNPGLRGDMDTAEVMEGLRAQALAQSRGAAPAKPKTGGGSKRTKADRRKQTITFFFEQKNEELEEEMEDLRRRQRELETEAVSMKERYAEEITDFLSMIAGGGDVPEVREVLRDFRRFLSDIGLTETQAVKKARGG